MGVRGCAGVSWPFVYAWWAGRMVGWCVGCLVVWLFYPVRRFFGSLVSDFSVCGSFRSLALGLFLWLFPLVGRLFADVWMGLVCI